MSTTQAAGKPKAIAGGVLRFLAETKRSLTPRHRMTAMERRELQRRAAKDPEVERALQELLAERPELRQKTP